MTPKEKQRIETLLTANEHLLSILAHKKLAPKELADMRQIKGYVAALKAEIEREGEL